MRTHQPNRSSPGDAYPTVGMAEVRECRSQLGYDGIGAVDWVELERLLSEPDPEPSPEDIREQQEFARQDREDRRYWAWMHSHGGDV